jgi:GPH family glycoside/pentoside/hexuronide:cation symporter
MAENEKAQGGGPKPISAKARFWYGFGDCWFTIMSNVETFFWNFFMTNVAMFATEIVTTISLIASLVDAFLSWIYGGVVNTVKPGKFGRYRTWLVMVPWVVPFLYAFQFLKIGEGVVSYVVVILGAIISHIVWNLPYAANATLVSVAGGTPEGRAALASSRATWNQLAGVFFSYLGLPLATVLAGIVGEMNRFGALAFLLGVVMAVGYWVNFKATEGYEEIETPEALAQKKSKTKASVKDMFKALFQNPHLCFLILGDLPKWIIKFVPAAAAIYYFRYAAQNQGLMVGYVLISNICAAVGAFIAAFLARKLTARWTVIITYAVMALSTFIAYFSYLNPTVVIFFMSVVQLGYGVCFACCSALYADTAVYAQWKLGVDSRGWIMGLQTFPLKFAVVGRALILNISLMLVGFDAKVDPAQATDALKKGATAAFALIPGIILCVGIIILFFGYRLTREKVVQYQEEIDARKTAAAN